MLAKDQYKSQSIRNSKWLLIAYALCHYSFSFFQHRHIQAFKRYHIRLMADYLINGGFLITIRNLWLFVADEIIRLFNKSINYIPFDCVSLFSAKHSATSFSMIFFIFVSIHYYYYLKHAIHFGLSMCVSAIMCSVLLNHITQYLTTHQNPNKYHHVFRANIKENRTKQQKKKNARTEKKKLLKSPQIENADQHFCLPLAFITHKTKKKTWNEKIKWFWIEANNFKYFLSFSGSKIRQLNTKRNSPYLIFNCVFFL